MIYPISYIKRELRMYSKKDHGGDYISYLEPRYHLYACMLGFHPHNRKKKCIYIYIYIYIQK